MDENRVLAWPRALWWRHLRPPHICEPGIPVASTCPWPHRSHHLVRGLLLLRMGCGVASLSSAWPWALLGRLPVFLNRGPSSPASRAPAGTSPCGSGSQVGAGPLQACGGRWELPQQSHTEGLSLCRRQAVPASQSPHQMCSRQDKLPLPSPPWGRPGAPEPPSCVHSRATGPLVLCGRGCKV